MSAEKQLEKRYNMAKTSYRKAVVRTYLKDRIPDTWAKEMEKWMGKEITLKIIDEHVYKINEDIRWVWEPDNFILLDGDQINPNFLFKHKKMKK